MAFVQDLSSGTSKILWEIDLIWNGGRKDEIHSFYWSDSVDDVNEIAIGLWDELGDPKWRDCEDNVDGSKTEPGKPYQGFACLDVGASSCLVTVAPVKHSKEHGGKWDPEMDHRYVPTDTYGIQQLKRILKSRQISYKAGDKKDDLAKQLHDYISEWIPASTKEEQQEKEDKEEKDGKENKEKDERNDGAPEAKRSKLELSAVAE